MASTSALQGLADAYDVALETLISKLGFNEATEQYFGNISDLGIDLTKINNYQ